MLRDWLEKIIIAVIILCSFVATAMVLTRMLQFRLGEGFFLQSLQLGIAGGFLGGGVYMARGFYQSIISKVEPFAFARFFWWYFFRSLLGGIAGGLAFLVIDVGFDVEPSQKNLVAIFLAGVLAGYNFTEFAKTKLAKSGADV